MTPNQRNFIRSLILYYDERGWDWSVVVTYLVTRREEWKR